MKYLTLLLFGVSFGALLAFGPVIGAALFALCMVSACITSTLESK